METKINIQFAGFINDPKWKHFLWIATINGEVFTYKTGIGHAVPKYKPRGAHYWGNQYSYSEILKMRVEGREYIRLDENTQEISKQVMALVPTAENILHALMLDAHSGSESFKSFCDNCGYSHDSIEALNIYRACELTAERLQKALGREVYNNYMNKYLNGEMEG